MDWIDRPLSGTARGLIMAGTLLLLGVLIAFGYVLAVVIIGAMAAVLGVVRRRRAYR